MVASPQHAPPSTDGGASSCETTDRVATVANGITLAGYGLGLWWIAGGPAWAALASIAADEADGIAARELGECSPLGAELDFGADLILAALSLRKVGAPWWALPGVSAVQIYLHQQGTRPPVGSLRAIVMLYALLQQGRRRKAAGRALRQRRSKGKGSTT